MRVFGVKLLNRVDIQTFFSTTPCFLFVNISDLPLRPLLLVVGASVGVDCGGPRERRPARQHELHGHFDRVAGLATDGVARVTVVGAVAGEAGVAGGRVEECVGEGVVGLVPNVPGQVEDAADCWRGAVEVQELVDVE